jgi:hypothetical protein
MPYLYLFEIGSYTCNAKQNSYAILSRRILPVFDRLRNGDPTGSFNSNGLVTDYVLDKKQIALDDSLFDHIVSAFKPNSKMLVKCEVGQYYLVLDEYKYSLASFMTPNAPSKIYYNVGLYN